MEAKQHFKLLILFDRRLKPQSIQFTSTQKSNNIRSKHFDIHKFLFEMPDIISQIT